MVVIVESFTRTARGREILLKCLEIPSDDLFRGLDQNPQLEIQYHIKICNQECFIFERK